jgi:mono/diheme cytochrome c family protein
MRYVSIVCAISALVMTSLLTLSSTDASPVVTLAASAQDNPIATSEESITAGRIVYSRFCRSCHGVKADGSGASSGDVPPANLIDDEWDHGATDAEIFKTIREGVPPDYFMEPWEGRVTDDAIWNVINYLRSLASE